MVDYAAVPNLDTIQLNKTNQLEQQIINYTREKNMPATHQTQEAPKQDQNVFTDFGKKLIQSFFS